MSVLVWVMGDGEHRDMIATCRAGNGDWLTFRWDYREDGGMVGFQHDRSHDADALLADWTEDLEANGSSFIAQPTEIIVNTPKDSWEVTVMRWWESTLRPIAVDIGRAWEPEPDDEVCTMTLPTALDVMECDFPGVGNRMHASISELLPKSPYLEKLGYDESR